MNNYSVFRPTIFIDTYKKKLKIEHKNVTIKIKFSPHDWL